MDYKTTISDIAKLSGFSLTTVSRVLNNKGDKYRISKKTQEKIKVIAKELSYVPNLFAANLKSGRSHTVALIIPSLNNPFFAGIASKVNSEIRRFGYTTIISDSNEDEEIEKKDLNNLISRNIEGIIIAPCGDKVDHLERINNSGIPVICIDRYFEDVDLPYVSTDNFLGASMATKHLIDNGHQNIACIQGVLKSTPNRLRVKGFIEAMEEAGLSNYTVVGDDFSMQNGYIETKILLQSKERPTAIFLLSNTIALGCLKALKEENIKTPDEISLITFDYNLFQDYLATPLTCISQPTDDISKISVKFLFANIQKKTHSNQKILLKPEIILKESVKNIINID